METLFLNLLSLTIPISVLILILYIVSPLMEKTYAAKWRMYMWIFCAVRLLFPVKFTSMSMYKVSLPIHKANSVVSAIKTTENGKLISILAAVWIFGVIVFAVVEIMRYITFKRNIKRWREKVQNKDIINSYITVKSAMGIKRKIDLCVCKKLSSPMIVGFLKPILLLPSDNYSKADAEIILSHELIHFKKYHLWLKLIMLVSQVVNWFNPFIHLMIRAANKDMELACDDEVIKNENYEFRRKYCQTILYGIHSDKNRLNMLTTCFSFHKRILLDRFKNILNTGRKRNGIVVCMVVCALLLCGSMVVSFSAEEISKERDDTLDSVSKTEQSSAENNVSPDEDITVHVRIDDGNYEVVHDEK